MSVASYAVPKPPRIVVGKFFDDNYRPGGFDYTYPSGTKIAIAKGEGYNSNAALRITLDASDYAGASVCLYNETFDLSNSVLDGAIEFQIKGAKGGEQIKFGLLDEEVTDGKKTQVALPLNKYVQITTEWQKVVIPLADFPERGLYYDPTRKAEFPAKIDWSKIGEFRVSSDKGVNKGNAQVWIDNVEIAKGTVKKAAPKAAQVYWDEIVESVDGPVAPEKLDGKAKTYKTFYDNGLKGFSYSYGGKTAMHEQESKTKGNPNVLAMYLDDGEYSGITMSIGAENFIDISKQRDKGGVYFWIKGKKGGETALFGLMDNQGNDIKSQAKVNLKDWVQITDKWQLVKIPLKRFQDKGKAWDANKQAEVTKDMKWDKIQEMRFSVNKGDNKREIGDPVVIYVDQITFTDNIDWVDPDLKWDTFKSTAPDLVIQDFENNPIWEPSFGPKSKLKLSVGASKLDGKALLVDDYLMNDWVDNVYDFEKQKAMGKLTDWTKHWAIQFDMYTDKPWQGITVQLGDKGREIYVANTGASRGRHTLLVPLRSFNKFPYYQPPEAIQNGILDLDGIKVLDFKPSGEGTTGSFQIDNIKLTNLRELPKQDVVTNKNITIAGDFNKVINPAISNAVFGINAALWDGDLLKDETERLVKNVNHGIVRYPGGLRADDDHWEKILENKDWMVDTDEFLEWCKKTNTSPMFTVNFGTGTAEEAARWVEYVNVKKKANVKYWEIGNEIYGNWHPQYEKYGKDGGTIYGKRAREFVLAMKKVDPTIKVAVVGVLEGPWNENVMKETADIADAIIVHHYPQHFGEENDFAILSAPQSLEGIFERLHASMKKISKKQLEIWLTEWGSVDFNPGPQTLSLVNGLFVADYLGMLTKVGAGSAQYWDIHNDLTPEGGDYGYLTRSYDEQVGGNVPRPSYWAFEMASEGLRGKLVDSKTGDDDITSYLAENGTKKALLVVNKSPVTAFKSTLKIPGFVGKAKIETLAAPGQDADKVIKMGAPTVKTMDLKEGATYEFPTHSVTLISIN